MNSIAALYILLSGGSGPASLDVTAEGETNTVVALLPQFSFTEEAGSEATITTFGPILTFYTKAEGGQDAVVNLQGQLSFTSHAGSATTAGLQPQFGVTGEEGSETVLALQGQLSFTSEGESDATITAFGPVISLGVTAEGGQDSIVELLPQMAFSAHAGSDMVVSMTGLSNKPSALATLKVNKGPRTLSPWLTNSIWSNIVSETDEKQGLMRATSTGVNASGTVAPLAWTPTFDPAGFLVPNPQTGTFLYFFPSVAGYYKVTVKGVTVGSASGNAASVHFVFNGVATLMDANVASGANQSVTAEDIFYFDGVEDRLWISVESGNATIAWTQTLLVYPLALGTA